MKVVASKALVFASAAVDVASAAILSNCKHGCASGEECVGNPHSQPVDDGDCSACATGTDVWPCNFETLCYCWDASNPRIPPAPASGFSPQGPASPCGSILTEDMFRVMAPDARIPYTYEGLCEAVVNYNRWHDEKAFGMGSPSQQRAELAAFLGIAMTETGGFAIAREELPCGDSMVAIDGKLYCKPCKEEHFDSDTQTCAHSVLSEGGSYVDHCTSTLTPPQGCGCSPVTESAAPSGVEMTGYMAADDAYFGRGAIRLSSNRDYIGMSIALTGTQDNFCAQPDLLATVSQHAWGAGVYYWMERLAFGSTGSTCHTDALRGKFGGVVANLHGLLECPANPNISQKHDEMVKLRLNNYCRAANAIGIPSLLSFDGCDGLADEFEACVVSGECPDCVAFASSETAEAPAQNFMPPTEDEVQVEEEDPHDEGSTDWFTTRASASTKAVPQIIGALALASLHTLLWHM